MKKMKLGLIALLFFFFSPLPAFSSDFVVAPPPKSMDKYYADSGKISEWIAQMRKLSTAFSAIFVSLDKENWVLAEKYSAKFIDSYKKASEMIPEWKEEFDLKAANELKERILAKDMKKLGRASETLGKTCSHCHSKKQHQRLGSLSLAFNRYHKSTGPYR